MISIKVSQNYQQIRERGFNLGVRIIYSPAPLRSGLKLGSIGGGGGVGVKIGALESNMCDVIEICLKRRDRLFSKFIGISFIV